MSEQEERERYAAFVVELNETNVKIAELQTKALILEETIKVLILRNLGVHD